MSPSTYRKRIRKMRTILASVQWYQQSYNGYASCPCCDAFRHEGHAADCELALAAGIPVGVEGGDE